MSNFYSGKIYLTSHKKSTGPLNIKSSIFNILREFNRSTLYTRIVYKISYKNLKVPHKNSTGPLIIFNTLTLYEYSVFNII